MMATAGAVRSGSPTDTATTTTRALLACGVVAGPLYIAVVAIQALTRDGFDLTRHPASLLSTGDLGWVQVTTFVVSGLLTIACAVGMRRVLRTGMGGTWGPLLVGAYGTGLITAGVFVADPADGFPPGTPAGPPDTVSWHGAVHFAVAGIAFLALVAACLVFARRFAGLGQRGWAAYCVATGVIFLSAFAGIASGSGAPALNVAFAVAVVLGWAWVSVMAARLMTEEASGG
jgi:hypothetical membrane protein